MAHRQLPKAAAAASAASLKSSKAFTSLDAKAVLTHIGVGMGAASFWRGAWYILDDHLFPDDPALSALTSFGLGCTGMTLSQGLVGRLDRFEKHFKQKSRDAAMMVGSPRQGGGFYRKYVLPVRVARFGALYTIAISCVLVWRGTWLGWDVVYEMTHPINRSASNNSQRSSETDHPHHHHQHHVGIEQLHAHQSQSQQHSQHPHQQQLLQRINSTDPGHATTSGILSHVVALTVLCGTGLFASVLAPPAATSVIRDFTVKAASMTTKASGAASSGSAAAAAASSKAFGTGASYSGPAQNLVAQLFGGGGSSYDGSSTTTTSETISSSTTSNFSTPVATASFHHNARNSLTVNSNNTVISKSPQLRLKETPKMSRNHNPLGGHTATSIH